ncbi:hypothetical protein cypCar_00012748 [Cyprinus carpio]|nr:hypothetical protein cypCar_00012748 [Cyprinus carpio]
MFTPHQTGRPASPHPVLQKTVCGRCAVCKVHLNSSADPRLLPCLHIVCNTCLTKICTDGATQDCPLCAQSFCLSEVTECAIFEDTSNNNNIPKCGGCEESEVSGWCVQCEEALCLDCTSAHRRVKVTRDHEVTPKKPPTGWTQRRRCPSHTQESLRFFCLVCEELTCKDCQLITHRGHSFVQQEEAVGLQRQQLQSLLDSIRQQKETVISSLLLLEARLQEIEKIKTAAKKMLTQVVHSIYQALVLKATQMLKVIEALFAEEVGCLLEKKTSLNKLEGCQEYIAAFIDKILCTEGHGLLVHTKSIETQGKKLLSQKAYTPETMIELHLQIQNELCQHIMKFASSGRMNHCPQDPCAPDPTSTISNAIPSTASGSLLPVNPVASAPISGNGTLWSKSSTYNSINVPVKALADSACDQDADVSSTNFTDTDHLESNLPTSLVSETAPKEPSPDRAHSSGPSDIHQDSPSTITEKCSRQALDDQSSTKNYSGPKHWSVGMPTTFRQLVEATCIPVRSKDNLNTTPPADSTPCSTSEDLDGERTTHFKTVQSASDYREAKKEDKKEDKEPAVTVEHFRRQIKQLKRSLRVSLECLPISLPPSGQPLPEFHLTTDASTGHILVQESRGGQVYQVWRWHEDPLPSRSSSCSVSQDSDSSPASDVEFCAVCLSAGAPLLCAKCGCAFHYDCHIPQILTKPCKDWVCLLCQDVNETVVYGSEEMRTPSLSLEDQRKCEKLVFGLLCDENKSLLFSATKNHSKTAEFDIILGRLLGKRKPPYRTVAELVSDVWTLFDILMMNSEKKNMVVKLKQSFQQQLNESFGKSLHPSLLNHSSSKDPSRTPETEIEQEKHRNTLKRMREFFTANCGTAAKKSCNDKGKEKDGCGNTAAAEY